MAKDIQDRVGQFLGSDSAKQLVGVAVNELLNGLGNSDKPKRAAGKSKSVARKTVDRARDGSSGGLLSGASGIAAGAGAAALAPVAVKGVGKLIKGGVSGSLTDGPKKLVEGAGSKLGDAVGDKVTGKIDDAGGPSGIVKDAVKSALPFGGGGDDDDDKGNGKNDAQGVGKGRRMPVQQSVDVALPVETVYNQWTQYELWPKFMHRVKRVSQEDPCKVSFTVKIWGKTKEFTAEIETQRPDDRIKWKTTDGMNVAGVVTFRELAPNLTRILLSFDVDPGSLIEKYARGARYVKRAARADLHRFAAFIEMLEQETGAWRGVIEDGEVVEDHDSSYDKKREYASADELLNDSDDDEDDEDDEKKRTRSATRSKSSRSSSRTAGRKSRTTGRKSGSASSASRRRASSSSSRSRSSSRSSSGKSSARSGSGKSAKSSSGTRGNGSRASGSGSSSRSSRSRASSSNGGGRRNSSSKARSSSSRSSANGHQGRTRSQSAQRSRSSRRG